MSGANTIVTPAPATVITRREQPVTYVSGNKQVIPLSKNLFSRGIMLHLTGALTCTNVNNTVANTQIGDEWGCITKIEIYVNSATLLFSAAGSDLKFLAKILNGHRPRIQPNLGDGATANPAFDSTIYIPFLNPRSRRPFDTILACPEFSDYRLEVTWATDWTSINSASTGYATNPNLEVYQRVQSAPTYPYGSPKAGQVMLPNFFRRMLKTPVVFAGANPDFPKQLNTGPIYRGLILNVNNAGTDSHTLLTNVKVDNGATVYKDVNYLAEQAFATQNWDIPEEQGYATATGIWVQTPGAVNTKQDPLAWSFVDFCEDGFMSEAIDTQAVGDTFVHFNVSGACTVNIFTQELIRIQR